METITFLSSRFVVATTMLILLGSCANTINYPDQPAVAPGSRIQLNIAAEIPVDAMHLYIQNGAILSVASLDKFETYCSITMHKYQEKNAPKMHIKPGDFTIYRIRLYNDFFNDPVIYANNDDPYYSPSGGVIYRTELHLKSGDQPDVRSLNCTNRKESYVQHGYYPNRSDFETVFGDLIDLQ